MKCKLNCGGVQPLLDAYVDGEVDPMQSQAIEQHVRECASCHAELDKTRMLKHMCDSASTVSPEMPEDTWSKIVDSTALASRKRPARLLWRTLTVGAVAASIIAGATLMVPAKAQASNVFAKSWAALRTISTLRMMSNNTETGQITYCYATPTANRIDDRNISWIIRSDWVDAWYMDSGEEVGVDTTKSDLSLTTPANLVFSDRVSWATSHNATLVDEGEASYKDVPCRVVGFITSAGDYKCLFWVDEASDLPLYSEGYAPSGGGWQANSYTTYEYNVPLDSNTFDVPTNAQSTGKIHYMTH